MTDVIIGNSVTDIPVSTFASCYKLSTVTIGNNVESIGNYAFGYTNDLQSLTLPDSVTSIGWSAFRDSGLTTLTLSNNNGLGLYPGTQEVGGVMVEVVIPDYVAPEPELGNNYFLTINGESETPSSHI